MTAKSTPIFGFAHIAAVNGWKDIVVEQFEKLDQSGLLAKTSRCFVSVAGPEANVYSPTSAKIEVVNRHTSFDEYELPALRHLQQFCRCRNCLVYYIHTKGVFSGQQSPTVVDWRRLMEYFIIER